MAWFGRAVEAGARLRRRGRQPRWTLRQTATCEPTVLTGVRPEMDVSRQEIFGPVVALRTFGDEDDVVAWANDTDAGLSAYRVHP